MNRMFANARAFNRDISGWDVHDVTDMHNMFYGAALFNRDLSKWELCTGKTETAGIFTGADAMQASNKPSIRRCKPFLDRTSLKKAVEDCLKKDAVNGCRDMNDWNVSSVTDMHGLFENKQDFNGDISR